MECYQMLKAFDDDWKEYKKLRGYVRTTKRKLMNGTLGERAAYNYYINKDRLKELKKRLIEKGLIKEKAPNESEV